MNNEITIKEALEGMADYGFEIWVATLVAIVVFVVEHILCVKGIIFSGREKKLEKAKKAGNMLRATRISCRYKGDGPGNKTANRRYIAQYEYYVGSERRTKQIISTSMEPPTTITLYYTETPDKVFSDYDRESPLVAIIYILPLLVGYFVALALGYEFQGGGI